MRYNRQNKILDLITSKEIKNQDMLVKELRKAGYKVTQSTISRDIRELNLIKVQTAEGSHKYATSNMSENAWSARFNLIIKETVTSYTPAGNIVVVKTLSGCGSAAGEALDNIGLEHVAGSVAGDNTLLLVVDDVKNVPEIIEVFDKILK